MKNILALLALIAFGLPLGILGGIGLIDGFVSGELFTAQGTSAIFALVWMALAYVSWRAKSPLISVALLCLGLFMFQTFIHTNSLIH